MVTGLAAGAGGHGAVGKVVGVGQHRVILTVGQHSGALLVRTGQILLQIAVIVRVVVAVHQRLRSSIPIHQIDRIARIQQVGDHLLVRAGVITQHSDLPDLHRTLAGDLDAVCIRSDELGIAAVLYGDMPAVYPQCSHAAFLVLGAVDDGQDVILIDDHLRGRDPEAVQIQRAAAGGADIGHVVRIVRQQLDNGVIRPVRHGFQRFVDGRIQRTLHLAVHHPAAAGCAEAGIIQLYMGAGRAADRTLAGLRVNGVGGVFGDGHRLRVQPDIHAIPQRVRLIPKGMVLRGEIVDGIALRVSVGVLRRQILLQSGCTGDRTGVHDAVGVRIGDERAAAELDRAQRAAVQPALEGAALDIQLPVAGIDLALYVVFLIRRLHRPALGGGDVHVLQRQVAVGVAPYAGFDAYQLNRVAVAGILDRAVSDGEAVFLIDLEHGVAAAGERVPVQIQQLAGHLAGHHQRLRAHIHVAQQCDDGAAIFMAFQRLPHVLGVFHGLVVLALVQHQPRHIDALIADLAHALGRRADLRADVLVRADVFAGAAHAVHIAVLIRGRVADKVADGAAVTVGLAVRIGNVVRGVVGQRRAALCPVADAGCFVSGPVLTVKGIIHAVFVIARAVGVVKAQDAGFPVLRRACVLRIAPLVRRAAGEGHGGHGLPVRPGLRLAAGSDALDLIVAALPVPAEHIGKRRILARRRQRAPQQTEHRQTLAGKGRAVVVRNGHCSGAAGLPVNGQRFGTIAGERDAAVDRQAGAVAEDDAGHFPGNGHVAVDGHIALDDIDPAVPHGGVRLDLDIVRGRGGFPVFVHIGHRREALDDRYIGDTLDIKVLWGGSVAMLIGITGGEKVGDIHPFIDRAGVILGRDVHAAEAPAIEPDRTFGIFQRHAAGGGESAAAELQRAALDRDGAGFVSDGGTVKFLAAVGKIALDRDAVVDNERGLAAHGDRGGIIHSADRAAARDGERAAAHVNDRRCIPVRIAGVGVGDGVPIQIQRGGALASEADPPRKVVFLRQIHVVQQLKNGVDVLIIHRLKRLDNIAVLRRHVADGNADHAGRTLAALAAFALGESRRWQQRQAERQCQQ